MGTKAMRVTVLFCFTVLPFHRLTFKLVFLNLDPFYPSQNAKVLFLPAPFGLKPSRVGDFYILGEAISSAC